MPTDQITHEDYPLYKGHVAPLSRWAGVQVENSERVTQEGRFEIRVLAPYPEGGWIYERLVYDGKRGLDIPADLREFGLMPDENLRRLFVPMDADMALRSTMQWVFGG